MPTRALGALLAAVAAVLFVASIVTSAWWGGHPRVDGHVFTAKDVHIGLLGGEGCNTGGDGDCQPLELGATFETAAYGELGAIGLATAFAILVAAAAWRVSDGRKRMAKLGLVVSAIAAAGAVALIVIGPEIKSSARVEAPIGWGMLVFGGGIVASLLGGLATLRVEREPLRLKTYAKPLEPPPYDVRDLLREQHDGLRPSALGPEPMLGPGASGSLPGPAGPLGAPLVPSAPQLRPLYDVQGTVPTPAAPQLPQRAPTPIPRASAHQIAGLNTPPPDLEPYDPRRSPSMAETFDTGSKAPRTAPAFGPSTAPAFGPSDAPTFDTGSKAPTTVPAFGPPAAAPFGPPAAPPFDRSRSPSAAPPFDRSRSPSAGPPFDTRSKPKTAPPPPLRGKPPSIAPFANPAIDAASIRTKSPSTPPRPADDPSVDPLGKTMPAPSRPSRPSVPLPAKLPPGKTPPAPKTAPLPTPTPSLVTSAPKPPARAPQPELGKPQLRSSQPTLAHAVPPMPQIDTPPPQLRAPTETDDSLENAMRETETITAVEIDHEAKALFEEQRRHREGRAETAAEAEPTGISEPPTPDDDTDSVETAGRERVDLDAAAKPEGKPAPAATGAKPAADAAMAADAAKAADAVKPAAKPAVKPPLSTAPASLPPPKTATLPVSGPTPACPQCESPMAWVEEHLRFYCKSCRMYF